MQVIIAYILNAYNDSGIGSYRFDALPRIGDHIVLQFDSKERYLVTDVEHWPTEHDASPLDPIPRDNTFMRVQHITTL
jgi:hypothetical protein